MIAREVLSGVSVISGIDWDRRYFDELVPLPHGTSYNSYLVRGASKTALIDTMYPARTAEYIACLKQLQLPSLDYIIANHGEQDHSGSIAAVLQLYPHAQVVTNSVCRELITDAMPVPEESFRIVADCDTLDLGGRTLRFHITPYVHWPDTMLTHLVEDGMLFTCDLFGSHLATTDLFAEDEADVLASARRYYAEIMMPFRVFVAKYLKLIDGLAPRVIGASHGPVYGRPALILDAYRRWNGVEAEAEVVIPHVSMYQNTSSLVLYLVDRLMERGIKAVPYNVVEGDAGELAAALVTASTLVIATSTVLGGPHPAMAAALNLINALKPKAKHAAVIGSYGWGETLVDDVQSALFMVQAEYLDPVIVKGKPGPAAFAEMDRLAAEIAEVNAPLASA